ncbi:hypothetical protein CVQ51_17735 [Salmonella enterica]|nr:hypothetical protein [Salmonella enterica]
MSSPLYRGTAPDIAGYISICASFSLLSPLAFSGQALLPLATPYPFRPFSFGWRRLAWQRPDAAPEFCTKITPKYLTSNNYEQKITT